MEAWFRVFFFRMGICSLPTCLRRLRTPRLLGRHIHSLRCYTTGATEVTQLLRALVALARALDLILSTHITRGSDSSFWLWWAHTQNRIF